MELGTMVSSVINLMGLAKQAIDARDDAKAKAAITDAHQKLYELSMTLLDSAMEVATLQAANIELNAKCRELEKEIVDKARHQLTPLGKNGHAYALLRQDVPEPVEPAVYFCQHCYDKGIKSILRLIPTSQLERANWVCVEANPRHNICA